MNFKMLRSLVRRIFRWKVRTPLFPQLEVTECGAACLGAILAYYGKWVTIEELRTACGVSRDGSSAADIVTAWSQVRPRNPRVGAGPSPVSNDIDFPAILFWEFNHFVVLERINNGRYYLNDPANGTPLCR